MLQITGSGKLVFDESHLANMRATYSENRFLRLPKLIEPSILKRVVDHIEAADFFPAYYNNQKRKLGEEIRISPDNPAIRIMSMMLNNSELFQIVEKITGCEKIRSFLGRIRRESPGTSHFLDWHDDPKPTRLVGISINLSPEPYIGGVFQLREKATEKMMVEIANTGLGDAFIFQVSNGYQHRVTNLEGTIPRTTCTGWFYSEPDFLTMMGFNQQK
ncbi:MAG TPA: 2OG-Fe(II) oxygenase [Blastocatellia bacterium]|nr:2OG-Fe(II) oxygenase [Blastocatellia bacterium]